MPDNDEAVEKTIVEGLYRQHKVFMYEWGQGWDKSIPSFRTTCGVCGDWATDQHPWYTMVPSPSSMQAEKKLVEGECSGQASFAILLSGKNLADIQEAYARSKSAGRSDDAGPKASP